MHPSIRHYSIRVERDDVVVDVPAHGGSRRTHAETLRLDGDRRSLRDRLWGAARRSGRRRSAPAPA
jgi:hypothetical protein